MFYLDLDVKKNCFYIAPYRIPKSGPYLIIFKERFKADEHKRKLMSGQIFSPDQDPSKYLHVETYQDEKGEVKIFKPR